MPRLTLRLVAAALTFIIGVALTSLWLVGRLPSFRQIESQALQPVNQELSFRLIRDRHGPNSRYYDYEATDSMTLTHGRVTFPSAERANDELEYRINHYPNITEILERSPKTDDNGHVVGERLVIVYTDREGGHSAEVVWTNGDELCWIVSLSLRHVLELERQGGF